MVIKTGNKYFKRKEGPLKLEVSISDVSGEKSYKHKFLLDGECSLVSREVLDPLVDSALEASGMEKQEVDEVKVKIAMEV